MDVDIRPIAADELEAYLAALEVAFSSRLEDEDLERERSVAAPERYLAAFDAGSIISGAASAPKQITLPGDRIATTAFVTAVGVQATHRRRGINTALMRYQLDELHERGEAFATLFASEGGIYGRFGYGLASMLGEVDVQTDRSAFVPGYEPSGHIEFLEREAALPAMRPIYDTARRRRPGMLDLDETWFAWRWWLRSRDRDSPLFHAIHRDQRGEADGYVVYTVNHEWPDSIPHLQLEIRELIATTPGAFADLWRFVFDVDLVRRVKAWNRPVDEPLPWMMAEPRQLKTRVVDALWVRLVDVPAASALRGYAAAGRVTIGVEDHFCPWNEGTFSLEVDEGGNGSCASTEQEPDLVSRVNDLGATFLGGSTFAQLAAAGHVQELVPGSVARADQMFGHGPAPWCSFIL